MCRDLTQRERKWNGKRIEEGRTEKSDLNWAAVHSQSAGGQPTCPLRSADSQLNSVWFHFQQLVFQQGIFGQLAVNYWLADMFSSFSRQPTVLQFGSNYRMVFSLSGDLTVSRRSAGGQPTITTRLADGDRELTEFVNQTCFMGFSWELKMKILLRASSLRLCIWNLNCPLASGTPVYLISDNWIPNTQRSIKGLNLYW